MEREDRGEKETRRGVERRGERGGEQKDAHLPFCADWRTGYWSEYANQRAFCDEFARKFDVRTLEHWYHVTARSFSQAGGGSVLHNYYGGSLPKLLEAVYPDYQWLPWRFNITAGTYWDSHGR